MSTRSPPAKFFSTNNPVVETFFYKRGECQTNNVSGEQNNEHKHPSHSPNYSVRGKARDALSRQSPSIIHVYGIDMSLVEQEVRKITTEDKKVDKIMAIMANAYNNNHKRGVTP